MNDSIAIRLLYLNKDSLTYVEDEMRYLINSNNKEKETLSFDLDDLYTKWREVHPDIDIVCLEFLRVNPMLRNKGIATDFINGLIHDKDKLILVNVCPLDVELKEGNEDKFDEEMERLESFYSKFGFIEVSEKIAFTEGNKLFYYPYNKPGRLLTELEDTSIVNLHMIYRCRSVDTITTTFDLCKANAHGITIRDFPNKDDDMKGIITKLQSDGFNNSVMFIEFNTISDSLRLDERIRGISNTLIVKNTGIDREYIRKIGFDRLPTHTIDIREVKVGNPIYKMGEYWYYTKNKGGIELTKHMIDYGWYSQIRGTLNFSRRAMGGFDPFKDRTMNTEAGTSNNLSKSNDRIHGITNK